MIRCQKFLKNDIHDASFKVDEISESEDDDDAAEDEMNEEKVESDFTGQLSFIVYLTCLLPLFRHCFACFRPVKITKIFKKGTQLIIYLICPSNHSHKWFSQPMIRLQPRGNLILSSSILISRNKYQSTNKRANGYR